jgi:hypothetical protein
MSKCREIRIFILEYFGIIFLIVTGISHTACQAIEESKVHEMTLERAQRLFEKVGGTETVTRESKVLLSRCNMQDNHSSHFLNAEDLTDTPAIASLFSKCEKYSGIEYTGTSIQCFHEGGSHYLMIKFGNHFKLRHIYIFDADSKPTANQLWIKVAEHIFIEN